MKKRNDGVSPALSKPNRKMLFMLALIAALLHPLHSVVYSPSFYLNAGNKSSLSKQGKSRHKKKLALPKAQ